MPAARCELLIHRAGDVWVVVDPLTDNAHQLNPTAHWVLHQSDGATEADGLAAQLASLVGISEQQALVDVRLCLAQLESLGLLESA